MRVSLDRLDARGLTLELPASAEAAEAADAVSVTSADALRGILELSGDRVTVTGGAAERLALARLHLRFGSVTLATDTGAELSGVAFAIERHAARLSVDVTAAVLETTLSVTVGDDVLVRGRARLENARLIVREGDGSLAADRVAFRDFTLRVGTIEATADTLDGTNVTIRWGDDGFGLDASSLATPSVTTTIDRVRALLREVAATSLAIQGSRVAIGRVQVRGGNVAANLRPSTAATRSGPPVARPSTAPRGRDSTGDLSGYDVSDATDSTRDVVASSPGRPIVDLGVLDGLSGTVDVDVDVDLTIPILGSRKATHRLRVPIDAGSLDFRALEKNLSALENALLDFSVRDGDLVLERVNPLFPARGHGKPVVRWTLPTPDDATLASQDRVRVALLPRARLEGEGDVAPRDAKESKKGLALRRLGLLRVNVRLALAERTAPQEAHVRLRNVDALVVQGNVLYDPGEAAPEGQLLGEIVGLGGAVDALPIGSSCLDVANVGVGTLTPIDVGFADLSPTRVAVDLADLVLEGIGVRPLARA